MDVELQNMSDRPSVIHSNLESGPELSNTLSSASKIPSDTGAITNGESYQYVKEPSTQGSLFMAVYMGLMVSMGGFLYGFDTGMINNLIAMPYVKKKFTKDGEFTTASTALLTSILSVGTCFGSIMAPLISDKYGRRFSILCSTFFFFNLGTLLQMVANNISLLYAGRFFNGFGVGVISAITPLYQAEISPKWVRGSVITFYQWAITWGLFVSSAISQGTKDFPDARCYRIPIGLQFVFCAFFVVFLWTLPESPRYYIMHNDTENAILSLSKVRKLDIRDPELIEELIEIKAAHDYEKSLTSSTFWEFLKGFKNPIQLKRMVTGILIQAFQQCSGINFIFYYGVDFFSRLGIERSYLMSFITYAVNVFFTIPGIILVEVIGRRKLIIYGALGMFLSNFIIAIVGLTIGSVIADKVMLAFVCVFIAFFAASWGPVVWVITGELFPLGIRQKGVSICACSNWLLNFIFAYITPYLLVSGTQKVKMGTSIFFLWGGFNFLGGVCAYFLVYETQGLMLEDVDELYRKAPHSWKSSKVNKQLLKMQAIEREREFEALKRVPTANYIGTTFTTNEVDDYLAMIAEEQAREMERGEQGPMETSTEQILYRHSSAPPSDSPASTLGSEFHFTGLYN